MDQSSIVHVLVQNLQLDSGELEFIGAVTDVTKQQQTEADLQDALSRVKESEAELRTIIEGIPTLAWSTRADGYAEFFSQRWLNYTGLSQDNVQGTGWAVAIHPDDKGMVVDQWTKIIASAEPGELEARLRRFDGEYRWFLFRAAPFTDQRGHVLKWFGTNTDIEDLKRSEAELRKTQSELAHITRVTTLGELAASIAHEVNQPIAGVVINGNACLRWLARVQEESVCLTEARETLQRIIRDGNRAGEIIARIRALFKKTESAKEPLDLNETIREVLVLTRSEMDKQRVALRLELSSDLPNVLGDRVQLQQVTLNLILNALEAMAMVEDRERNLVITTQSCEGREVQVTVTDSGIGITPEKIEDIFTAFHTTKPSGLGMGLSISRSIVANHSGRLWVTAHDGPGASFHFTLLAAS
jgi:PAS domain S-box-containing protein